tara:strand:- start:357 stop:527 length:171 start_codon:yes stop_codon:yes gene_type:complete
MESIIKKKRNLNKTSMKDTIMLNDPKMRKALEKILPDSFKKKQVKKINKENYFIKK